MSNTNGFRSRLWLCLLALIFGSTAYAQTTPQMKVVISNHEIPGENIKSITISPVTGDIFIATTIPYVVEPANSNAVTITSFQFDKPSITVGASTTLSWTTVNADSCTASGGLAGWADTVFSVGGNLPNGTSTFTGLATGVYSFVLSCQGLDGSTDEAAVDLTVTAANALAINTFSAVPGTIVAGEKTKVSWDVANMQSCAPSGNLPEWANYTINASTGSLDITINTAATYSLRLDCVGVNGDTGYKTASVTVNPATVSCPEPALAGSTITWKDFWGVSWPSPVYASKNLYLGLTGYKGIEFHTSNVADKGSLTTISNTYANGARFGAISECPGVFDVPDNCKASMGAVGIVWSTGAASSTECQLKPDTTYYFNLTYTDGLDPATSTCDSTNCITTVRVYNPQ